MTIRKVGTGAIASCLLGIILACSGATTSSTSSTAPDTSEPSGNSDSTRNEIEPAKELEPAIAPSSSDQIVAAAIHQLRTRELPKTPQGIGTVVDLSDPGTPVLHVGAAVQIIYDWGVVFAKGWVIDSSHYLEPNTILGKALVVGSQEFTNRMGVQDTGIVVTRISDSQWAEAVAVAKDELRREKIASIEYELRVLQESTPGPKMREWVDSSGKHKIQAKLNASKSGFVQLEKSDGSKVSMAIDKLSNADQSFVRNRSIAESQRERKVIAIQKQLEKLKQ